LKPKNYSLANVVLFSARTTGYHQCVSYLLGNTRIRLDEFYPVIKLFDLFLIAEILTKEYVNVMLMIEFLFLCFYDSSFRLKIFFLFIQLIFTDRNKIDASVRKSALEHMTIMFLEIVSNLTHALVFLLFDQSLHITSLSDQEFQQQTFSIDFVFILIVN
jgi:hypothetical protein